MTPRSERELARAQRSEALPLTSEDVGQRHQAVRERRLPRGLNVTVALESRAAPAHEKRGDVEPRMNVRLAHPAAEQHERMIQHCPIAVGSSAEALDELGEEGHMVGVD